jgi:sterol 24-C-methyltransferase
MHGCRLSTNESFKQAIARHEYPLALCLKLESGQRVLDVGCGVGGPAREIARFADVKVAGINICEHQIERAKRLTDQGDLSTQVGFVKGDFMSMKFEDNSFDPAYAIEATCYTPSLCDVYSEVYRVLKPGGTFAVHEILMTAIYDANNPEHRRYHQIIAEGCGISNLTTIHSAIEAVKDYILPSYKVSKFCRSYSNNSLLYKMIIAVLHKELQALLYCFKMSQLWDQNYV